jgi:glutaredoxin-related protein
MARAHVLAFSNTDDECKMSQEYMNTDNEIDEAPVEITESMRRIAAYIAEFEAKYKQLEDEQRTTRRQQRDRL